MRPINLIPTEERRSSSISRTGPIAYLLVGTLGVILIGVVLLVLFSNQVNDHKGEVARLESEKTAVVASASRLAPYIDFANVSEQRAQTVAELADSRFDWSRVIHQLSLVLPGDVYFTGLAASAGGAAGGEETGGSAPSLQIVGCANGQAAVAGFVSSLKEIDGVTRLQLGNSTLKDGEVGAGGASAEVCARPGMAVFTIEVVFDDAPPSPDSGAGEIPEPAAEEAEGEATTEESSEGKSSEEESTESSSEGTETTSSQSAATSTPEATG